MKHVEEQLTAYLLNDLDAEEARAVERLLDEDERCRALAEEVRPTLQLLRRALAADAEEGVVLDAVHREKVFRTNAAVVRTGVRSPLGWVAMASVLVAVAGLAMLFIPPRVPSSPSGSWVALYEVEIAKNEALSLEPLAELPDVPAPTVMAKLEVEPAPAFADWPADGAAEAVLPQPRTLASRSEAAHRTRDVRVDDPNIARRFARLPGEQAADDAGVYPRTASPAPPSVRGGGLSVRGKIVPTLDDISVPAWPSEEKGLAPYLLALRTACETRGWTLRWQGERRELKAHGAAPPLAGRVTLREALDDLGRRFGVAHRVQEQELVLFNP